MFSDHVTDALLSLHWLRVPERIKYKIALLMYKVLHGSAQLYLGPFVHVADLPGRWALRSSSTSCLMVSTFKLSTVGSRAFEVSGPRIWNELSDDIVSTPSLLTFDLKHFCFRNLTWTSSFDIIYCTVIRPCSDIYHLGHN